MEKSVLPKQQARKGPYNSISDPVPRNFTCFHSEAYFRSLPGDYNLATTFFKDTLLYSISYSVSESQALDWRAIYSFISYVGLRPNDSELRTEKYLVWIESSDVSA